MCERECVCKTQSDRVKSVCVIACVRVKSVCVCVRMRACVCVTE